MKRSKKYQAVKTKIDKNKSYSAEEILQMIKDNSLTKFPGSVEVEVRLNLNQKQKSESFRGSLSFPHNFGKEVKVLAFVDPTNIKTAKSADISGGEELISKVEKGELEFDVVLAIPAMMPKIARLGKVLGRKGLMPNPKNGTVTTDMEKTIEKFKSGQRSYKLLQEGKFNMVIGKTDMKPEELIANYEAFMKSVREITKKYGNSIIASIRIKPTMGPALVVSESTQSN